MEQREYREHHPRNHDRRMVKDDNKDRGSRPSGSYKNVGNHHGRGRRFVSQKTEQPQTEQQRELRGYQDVLPSASLSHQQRFQKDDDGGGANRTTTSHRKLSSVPEEDAYAYEDSDRKKNKRSYHPPPASRRSDWKCLECFIWNYADEDRCHRCGSYSNNGDYEDACPPSQGERRQRRDRHDVENPYKDNEVENERGRSPQKSSSDGDEAEDGNGSLEGSRRHSAELDEFGRAIPPASSRDSNNGRLRTSSSKRIKRSDISREWPPCFEGTRGSEYILDNRSGMFYHADSDFFYDPQTKLYYGNKQASYYRYDPEKSSSSKFVLVSRTTTESNGDASSANAGSKDLDVLFFDKGVANGSSSRNNKPSISINLKTKKLPKTNHGGKHALASSSSGPLPDSNPTVPASSNPLQRQHQVDISKWSERQEEMKQEKGSTTTSSKPQQQETQQQSPSQASTDKKDDLKGEQQIPTTTKGEPICELCQRKFPSLEKLRYHERASKLHAENVLKKKAEKEQQHDAVADAVAGGKSSTSKDSSSSSKNNYVDRAQQRRVLHGDDSVTTAAAAAISSSHVMPPRSLSSPTNMSSDAATATSTEAVRPEELLGTSNVGNQMLQKLGWKSGQSLGRRRELDANNGGSGHSIDGNNKELRKDWDRIEALAASTQRK